MGASSAPTGSSEPDHRVDDADARRQAHWRTVSGAFAAGNRGYGDAVFTDADRQGWGEGALAARPAAPTQSPLPPGLEWLELDDAPPPAIFVPSTLPDQPVPVVVLLHGASSNPMHALPIMQEEAERRGFVVVAPKSVGITWDVIHGEFGPDVAAIDRVLAAVFDRVEADPRRVAVAGFSDGASYALTLGLANGELFPRILAFSPGFFVPARRQGWPAIFVSHGRADPVLPIDQCGRLVVAALRMAEYDVSYLEFDGGHQVPAAIVAAALDRWLGPSA
jgi:phospholipase/carboxylesterase